LHTKITNSQEIIWATTILGQSIVGGASWLCGNRMLGVYLGAVALNGAAIWSIAHFGSAYAYYVAYCVASGINYIAEFFLVYTIYLTLQQTGIPTKRPAALFQYLFLSLMLVAVFLVPYALKFSIHPEWRWFLVVGSAFYEWLSFALAAAPIYARVISAADDKRLTLVYLGLVLYVTTNVGAAGFEIARHLSRFLTALPTLAYLAALLLWGASCFFKAGRHQWDPSQTERLKSALRDHHNQLLIFHFPRKAISHD
jgi:hypothetical protein